MVEKTDYRKVCTMLFLLLLLVIAVGFSVDVREISASDHMQHTSAAHSVKTPDIEHPFVKPKTYSKVKRCNNCGMMINMWARTRHSYNHEDGFFTSCSIRCVADTTRKSGSEASNVQVALYMHPEKMVVAEEAFYVIGSNGKGTMTMHSKIAFETKEKAEEFAAIYGGKLSNYQDTFEAATIELPKSAVMIDKKRKKTGKIKEVTEATRCTVCNMSVAMNPQHGCQIWRKDNSTIHFCSTQCLVKYTADPGNFVKKVILAKMIWTKVIPEGSYESVFGLSYVVDSTVRGPMGPEAFPFQLKAEARDFAAQHGGKIVRYEELTPAMVSIQ
jgi:nitrous oxide reductase accessory protein NosL